MKYLGLITAMLIFAKMDGCTGLKVTAQDGSVVHGRTLEFGVEVESYFAVIPRGYAFTGSTPEGQGLSYKARYAACGVYCFDQVALMDGMNERGLSVGTFYFPGYAGYAEITEDNQSRALSPVEFPNWLLTQFGTLEEVKEGLDKVLIAPTVSPKWGPVPAPFHYVVYDQKGQSLVIEPIDGKLVVYDNPLGVCTNSPTFDWHMTNLRNYINLQTNNIPPTQLGTVLLAPFGQGSGMIGLPGDFTPPSRFVRAAFFSTAALPVATSQAAILQLFHLLNAFDIPKGIARAVHGKDIVADYTMATCARDPKNLRYYFKTYEDQTLKMVDLKQFDWNAQKIKSLSTGGTQRIIDVSKSLK